MKPIRDKPKAKLPDQIKRQPKRWLVNAFMYLLIFLNGMIILMSFLAITYIGQEKTPNPALYSSTIYSLAFFIALFNIFCLLNLLKMQRWGFWGFCIGAIATLTLQLYLDHSNSKAITTTLLTLGNPLILFCLLYMGGKRSAWHEMSKKQRN